MSDTSSPVRTAVLRRRSYPRVTEAAPTTAELLPLIEAAATAPDHASLHPWRVIELRGDARARLGAAFVEESGLTGTDAERLAAKPMRASLLLAVVSVHKESFKVHSWEQDAAAAGIAHLLTLLLDDAGWGVIWRTGGHTRSAAVRRVHQLADNEELLGWLYIGGKTEDSKPDARQQIDA
ncbi:MAG TPA: nitroreductase family protein, partial [Galbitalea sp.]